MRFERSRGGVHLAWFAPALAWMLTAVVLATPPDVRGQGTGDVTTGSQPIALTSAQEARARVLEGELRCPVCRSQSIRQSRSFMAEDMKRRIRILVAQGRTDAEIRSFFVERYGPWILLEPPKRGFNLAAWLLPGVVVTAGAVGLLLAARRWTRSSSRKASLEPPPESPYLTRLERELKETE